MKIIENNLLPLKGFTAINLFGFIFVRKGTKLTETQQNHEEIHTLQMREMGYVFFYIWYVTEWFLRVLKRQNAYKNISFEKEAYQNQYNLLYNATRKKFAWIKFI